MFSNLWHEKELLLTGNRSQTADVGIKEHCQDSENAEAIDDHMLNWVSPFSSLHVYHVICGDSFMLKYLMCSRLVVFSPGFAPLPGHDKVPKNSPIR